MVPGPPCRNITREVKTVVIRNILVESCLLILLVLVASLDFGVGLAIVITVLSFIRNMIRSLHVTFG